MNKIVYVFFYPDGHKRAGSPCYIGKGDPVRPSSHVRNSHNRALSNLFKRFLSLPVVVIQENLTESEAGIIETALIQEIGRLDLARGPLLNLTDGGDGISGFKFSSESLSTRASKLRGQIRTSEQRAHISEMTRAAMSILPEDALARMREAPSRPEVREKMSASARARLDTPESRIAQATRLNTPEAAAKRYTPARGRAISDGQTASWSDPETRQRRCALIKAARARNPKIWITNGAQNARVSPTIVVPEGWRRGRTLAAA